MSSKRWLGLGTALIAAAFVACSEDRTVNNYTIEEAVRISGTLWVWYCGVGDFYNNLQGPKPFAVQTGDLADIRIVYCNGWEDNFTTDDSSSYSRLVSKGLHQIIVSTRYTWPADTFQVYVENDTTFDLDIAYGVLDPDTLVFTFGYETAADSLGAQREWDILRAVNLRLNRPLNIVGDTPKLEWRWIHVWSRISVWYYVPLRNRDYNILEVYGRAYDLVETDTSYAGMLSVHPSGVYLCLD